MSTPTNDADKKVNWSVRLDDDDAARWDELHHALRGETSRRTLTKATLFRALLDLAVDPDAHSTLVAILTAEQ